MPKMEGCTFQNQFLSFNRMKLKQWPRWLILKWWRQSCPSSYLNLRFQTMIWVLWLIGHSRSFQVRDLSCTCLLFWSTVFLNNCIVYHKRFSFTLKFRFQACISKYFSLSSSWSCEDQEAERWTECGRIISWTDTCIQRFSTDICWTIVQLLSRKVAKTLHNCCR